MSRELKDPLTLRTRLTHDVDRETEQLKKIVAHADGLQLPGQTANTSRHFSNVLFNVMRGGVFEAYHVMSVEGPDRISIARLYETPGASTRRSIG